MALPRDRVWGLWLERDLHPTCLKGCQSRRKMGPSKQKLRPHTSVPWMDTANAPAVNKRACKAHPRGHPPSRW